MHEELTNLQIGRIDEIYNAVYNCILVVLSKDEESFPWDMAHIGNCADAIVQTLLSTGAAKRIWFPAIVSEGAAGVEYISEYEELNKI